MFWLYQLLPICLQRKENEVVSLVLDDGFLSSKVDENDFTKLIELKMTKGFQPYGELRMSVETSGSFMGCSSYTRMTQVMVKYED